MLAAVAARAFLLIILGLAPFVVSLDVHEPVSPLRGIVSASALVLLMIGAVAVRRRFPLAAVLVLAAALGSLVCAIVFRDRAGPVARGVWIVSPLVWCALAAFVSGTKLAKPYKTMRNGWAFGLMASATVLLASIPRIGSRVGMWATIAASDPGNEPASMNAGRLKFDQGDRANAIETWIACAHANPAACSCVRSAAEALLLDGSVSTALDLVEPPRSQCKDDLRLAGVRAEALVRNRRPVSAMLQADVVLAKSPTDAHALYAKGSALYSANNFQMALPFAQQARDSNLLGLEGALLVDRILIGMNALVVADADLRQLATTNPRVAEIQYLLGQVADRADRYHDAREDYLQSLQIDPRFVDARFALALLTLRHGARDEAKYNVSQIASIAPDDPRLPELQKLVLGQ